jgi:ubiquinol-cytochrome c reductase cytochrome c1 subunit
MRKFALLATAFALLPLAEAQEPAAAAPAEEAAAIDWAHWQAGNEIGNTASLQRGARNFMGYCAGCHSLKYNRYSRVAEDLKINEDQLSEYLLPAGSRKADYITTSLAYEDGEAWFGKAPPDLSLITRSKGSDYVYQFLKTFYADPATPTGVNNLALPGTAMPHVLSDLQGVQRGVFRTVESKGESGEITRSQEFVNFDNPVPGQLTAAQYDEFVRDTVNFLDYAGEPYKAKRIDLGIWVTLFLLVFTGLAYLLKKEYWRDVK